jgi:epoxyqueuosine reductase
MEEAEFRKKFAGGPIKRIGFARFLRNVLLAIGNSGDGALAPFAETRLDHPSPLVRGMAVWALARLLPREEFLSLAGGHGEEGDAEIQAEWDDAINREGTR